MTSHPRILRVALQLATVCLLPVAAGAQTIHKCVDAEGHVSYQQDRCGAGQRSEPVRLAAPPPAPGPAQPAVRESPAVRAQRAPRATRPAGATPMSFECRSEGGAVFYRHSHCPGSIPRAGAAAREGRGGERVRATRLPRSEACRRMRAGGRDGREHDEAISTYARNLGHDPCRRH